MANTVYVITGTNKGIGLGMVKALIARPSTTVVASVRSDQAAASLKSSVEDVAKGDKSELHIMLLDFTKAPEPAKVLEAFNAATSGTVDRIDVVVSNAAAASPGTPSLAISSEDLRNAFEINTIAPLMVFQGLWPLMSQPRATGDVPAKFIGITSSVGSIESQEPFPGGAYGPSKAALNWLVKSLHNQHENLVSVAVHPGWVQTDMGYHAAKEWKYDPGPPETVDDSVKGVLGVIDGASRETTSGKLVTQTGEIVPW
ncbi:Putative short-chain dehydrogenase/reductase SDR, NAD(P)-binding domain superfamily [Colletotrichum destructivum]|uniref:Short-chain dehydrogenase/reductase SDR, NAD(P)-binding domain superfamily n=1 Tax=Colletotrichum destructivum TaxID=34406 RepID=A0AAX4I2H2_9PEZI|nr:Putative short-chain dehydrogenase/reductase SDR, NAD(P)-binding domain superfamily [Colletotrichum destructivum]